MCRHSKASSKDNRGNKDNRRTSSGHTIISNDRRTATTKVEARAGEPINVRDQAKAAEDRTKDRAWVKAQDRKAEARAEDRGKDLVRAKVRDRVKDRDKDRDKAAAINAALIVRAAAISAAVRTVQAAAVAARGVLDNSSSKIAALSSAVRLVQNLRVPMTIRIQAAIASRKSQIDNKIKAKTNVLKINQTASSPGHLTIKARTTKVVMHNLRKRKKSTIRRKKLSYAVR